MSVREWFTSAPQVVEIVKAPRTPLSADEARGAIASLASHPGWLALRDKLDAQQAYLRYRYEKERHATLNDSNLLQLGIFWTGWLQSALDAVTRVTKSERPVTAPDDILRAFREVDAALEGVGEESPSH